MNEDRIWTELNDVLLGVFDDATIAAGPGTTDADVAEWDSRARTSPAVAAGERFRTAEVDRLSYVGGFARFIRSGIASA